MMTSDTGGRPLHLSRRDFVRSSAAATAGMVLPVPGAFASGSDTIRVGLVGCGGRGTGAARDSLRGSTGVELVALGDVFPDRLDSCRENLAKLALEDEQIAAGLRVTNELTFTGLDAYRGVIGSDIDLVILATPPAFRPAHLAAAINAGKHVFMEKPVAVDPVGIRSVLASAEAAHAAGLAIVAGTQRRHDVGYRETMRRIHDGAIGEVVAGQVYWNQGGLWMHQRKPEWSDLEWQLRNWLYFTWLSGDHIVEQHIHNIDVANWALGGHPIRAVGVGGRQWRTDPSYGHIYDHFAIDFEYANGAHVLSMCRQIDGSANNVSERLVGTRGASNGHSSITGSTEWSFGEAEKPNPYVLEHTDLVESIRAGQPLNEGRRVAESTLSAIMGREAAYTGQALDWDELLAAEQVLVPPNLAFGPMPVPPVAVPGETPLVRTWQEG
jgi:predicted dehydrogenase